VPRQHDHRDGKNCRVEQLLPHPFEQLRQRAGKGGDEASRDNACQDPAANPAIATRDGACDRKHDADDQAGFEYLAEDDDERSQHNQPVYCTVKAPRAFSLKSS